VGRAALRNNVLRRGPVKVTLTHLNMLQLKRFTIRTLLVVVTLVCVALALDAKISSRLAKLKSELNVSPTSSILSQGDSKHGGPGLRWQFVQTIEDLTTFYDRICLRRHLNVWHRRETLLGERALQSLSLVSDIDLGLTAVSIKRRAVGDQAAYISPGTFPIPKHAIRIAAKPVPKQDLYRKFELLGTIPENARLTQSEVLKLADEYVLQKISKSEFERYPNRKLQCSIVPLGEWRVDFHTNPISDAIIIIAVNDETEAVTFQGATPATKDLGKLFY